MIAGVIIAWNSVIDQVLQDVSEAPSSAGDVWELAEMSESQSSNLGRLIEIIRSGDEVDAENGRDLVSATDAKILIRMYWELDDWDEKCHLVNLVQDHHVPGLRKLMLDYLRAPGDVIGDGIELTKAVALGFVDEKYDRFDDYYQDRALLHLKIAECLAKYKLTPAPVAEDSIASANTTDTDDGEHTEGLPTKGVGRQLMIAAIEGNLTDLQAALIEGADINTPIRDGTFAGCTPLIMAFIKDRYDAASILINQGADINAIRTSHVQGKGQSPIWWAATKGHVGLTKQLLEKKVRVNTPGAWDSIALHQAASEGHVEVTRLLLRHGADITATEQFGRNALHFASSKGHPELVSLLLEAGSPIDAAESSNGWHSLHLATSNGHDDVVKILIAEGAAVDATISTKYSGPWSDCTPLILAVRSGFTRVINPLISAGADVNFKVYNKSVLEFATGKRKQAIRKILISAGAQ